MKYFMEVLMLKLKKYNHLNSFRAKSPSRHIPLALSLSKFTRYYWPGKVVCCGTVRENVAALESHINRIHRPPKPPPLLSLVPQQAPAPTSGQTSDSSDETVVCETSPKRSKITAALNKTSAAFPPGFMEDQNKYPPQHKPGDAEDFIANQEGIDYFLEVFKLESTKYSQLFRSKSMPLGASYPNFVLNYWPGILNCCRHVFPTCKSFQVHLTSRHLPPKNGPQMSVVTDRSTIPGPSVSTSSVVTVLDTSTGSKNGADGSSMESIHEEVRALRQRINTSDRVQVVSLLERTFELGMKVSRKLRTYPDTKPIALIENMECIWNAAKQGLVRWEELNNRTPDPALDAVRFAVQLLPVFTIWSEHTITMEHLATLCYNTVHNWKANTYPPIMNAETPWVVLPDSVKQDISSLGSTSTDDTAAKVRDFCRYANVSVAQNTKARVDTGFKDDNGYYHPMYRYGIAQILKLFCPKGVNKLRCCGRIYEMGPLRAHVQKAHEAKSTEPSISPV